MNRISPSDYVREYHHLSVQAFDATGRSVAETVSVTRYQHRASTERDRLIAALKKELGLKALPGLYTNYNWFQFPAGDPLGGENFYWQSIRRAFGFKGSPAEMRDVLRLAVRVGRIGMGKKDVAGQPVAAPTMAAYARNHFSLDCNGLVGNYFGLSPELYIGAWASISDREEKNIAKKTAAQEGWNGWVKAAVLSLDHIPLRPRKAASEAKHGDVLIDVQDGKDFAHIGMVESPTDQGNGQVNWRVVEWGSATTEARIGTDKDSHIKPFVNVKLTQGPNKAFGVGHASMGGRRFRYLFAAPEVPFGPATWGRCGHEGV